MDTHADVHGELFAVAAQRVVQELIVYTRALQQGVRRRADLVTNRKLSHIYLNTYHKWCVIVADGKPRFRSFLVYICYALFPLLYPRVRCIFSYVFIFSYSYPTAIRFSLLGFIQTAPAGTCRSWTRVCVRGGGET